MQIDTVRFGTVDIDENKTIFFYEGIPGLEDNRRYALLNLEDSNPIFWLQSVEDSGVCLPVVDTFKVLPEYAFNVSDEDVADLGIWNPSDLHVMSILVIPENIEGMTANLAAPIIVNIKTGKAKQIILPDDNYVVRYPVFNNILSLAREEDSDAGIIQED